MLENWPHMLGNGPNPCNQFMIGVFLFWGDKARPSLYPGHIGLGNRPHIYLFILSLPLSLPKLLTTYTYFYPLKKKINLAP